MQAKDPRQPQNGEIWLVSIPNQPRDKHQPRPAIVVSVNSRNKWCNDVIVVPITSSLAKPHPEVHVALPSGEAGLDSASHARCDQVTTLDKSLLAKGPLGAIALKYRWAIIRGVRAALGDTTN